MKKTYAFLLILITLITAASPVLAQAYRSQIRLLEELAIRQYDRGDMQAAQKQFGWIVQIEPENAIAREYLQKIPAQAAPARTAAPENRRQVITDISAMKRNLDQYEANTNELERFIRDLITENDALYHALYKRSREVAEMRAKFYGTPYEQAYLDAMKTIPIDRVPQRLHRPEDLLPENAAAAVNTQEENTEKTLEDIAGLNGKQPSGVNPQQLDKTLEAKRDSLAEKTVAIARKHDSLTRLKDELAGINGGLKQGNDRYADAIRKIDAYYGKFKEKIAKKNYVEQKMFSELIADYARKIKEIEELKNSVRTQDNKLTSFKPDIESSNSRLRDINEELKARDKEIARFKEMAATYKQQLSERDATLNQRNETLRRHEATIQNQQNNLALTDRNLDDVSRQVTGIEEELKESDIRIAQLKASVARAQKAPSSDADGPALKAELSRLKAAVEQARQDVTVANANIVRMTAREKELLAKWQALEKENTGLRQATTDMEARSAEKIKTLQKDLEAKTKRADTLSQRVANLEQNIRSLHPATDIRKAETPDTDLEERLRKSYEKLTAAETELTRTASIATELKEQLAQRDAEIETLKATPSVKIKADKKLLMDAIFLKDQELATAKEKLEKLQQAYDLLALQDAETPPPATQVVSITTPAEDRRLAERDEIEERDAQIKALRKDLASAQETVKAAEARIKAAEERASSREIKQDAIDEVIHSRDNKILALMTEIQALKDELAAEKAGQKEQLAMVDEAASARIIAEKELKANAEQVSKLHNTVKDLVSDIKAAKALVEKKSRDHDATLKELRRLSDILDQKKEELNSLQRRVNGSIKKAPAPEEDVKVTAPDCFKDCTPQVK